MNNPNAEHQRFIDSQPGNTLEQRENAAIEVLRKEMDTTLRSFNQTQNTIANYFLDGARGEKSIDTDTILDALDSFADKTEGREAKDLIVQEYDKYEYAVARARTVQRYIDHQRGLLSA